MDDITDTAVTDTAADPTTPMTLQLRRPLPSADGTEVSAIVLREPTAGELITISDAPEGMSGISAVKAVAENGGLLFVSKMGARDFMAATNYVNSFLKAPTFEGELPDTLSIPLQSPLTTSDNRTIAALELREPNAGELIKIGATPGVKGDLAALALISGVGEDDLRNIAARDFTKGVAYIQGFFGDGPTVGAVS